MTPENLISELEVYRLELSKILGRFEKSATRFSINREDDPRFRTFVIEIMDLLNDSIGKNQYSPLINRLFIEGITNYLHSPSYKSIEQIISVIDSIVTRLKRNPTFYNNPEEEEDNTTKTLTTSGTELMPPPKITLKFIWEHTPPSYYWKFLVFVFAVFCLGVTFANTDLYKSLADAATAKISTNNTVPQTKE